MITIDILRCFPYRGKFKCTSAFGKRESVKTTTGYSSSYHCGIDLVGQDSKEILCCASGTVTKTGFNTSMGNYVWISTNDGRFGTLYQHLAKYYVKKGDKVSIKQVIGVEGSTGSVTAGHLHFGVANNAEMQAYYKNDWINPAVWFGINNYFTKSIVGRVFDGDGVLLVNGENVDRFETTVDRFVEAGGSLESLAQGQSGAENKIYKIDDLQGVYKDVLFGRRWRVLVGLEGEEALDVSGLRCVFSIKKSSYRKPYQSTLSIFNLSPQDENKIIKSGQRFIIEAGYNGSFYGKIFEGQIIQPLREKVNGTDYKLTLISMDSERYLNQGIIGCSLVAQQSSRDAINALATKSTVKIGEGNITETQIRYPRGKVMFGPVSDYLNQIAKSENATFYVDGEKINIVKVGEVSDEYAFDLAPESGLVGTPTQNEHGVSFTCLLNPMIQVFSLVHIDNKKITGRAYSYSGAESTPVRALDEEGIYKVITIEYTGDTRGQNWYCKVDAISQTGSLPAMAVGNDMFVFG